MKTNKLKLASLLGLASILYCSTLLETVAQVLPSGYTHEKVTSTELPTAIAFTPDGRAVVCSSVGGKGIAIIVNKDGSTTPFFTIPNTHTNNEKGLIGLAFDPDFTTNGYVYVFYTKDLSANGDQSANCQNTIARITAKNYVADMSTLTTLLKLFENPEFIKQPNHDGGALAFGPDGKLYIASGDLDFYGNVKCFYNNAINCEATPGATFPPAHSQDTNLVIGKVLRINKDGSAPNDNPFYKAGDMGVRNYIFVLGLRNPYTMHFRKNTSQLWINDVGSSGANKREEINMINVSNPKSTTGKNLGYNNNVSNPANGTPPSTEGFFDANNTKFKTYTQPVQVYNPADGCAISGGTFYESATPTFEPKYIGKYFYMDFCQGWIKYMDADGKNINTFATGLAGGGSGFGSVSIEDGPDGNMYHLVRSKSAGVSGLYRIKGPLVAATEGSVAENKYAFSIHPNPANNNHKLNYHFNAQYSETGKIQFLDLMGKVKKTVEIKFEQGFNDHMIEDISDLPRGVYMVNFSTPNAKATKKLVVE